MLKLPVFLLHKTQFPYTRIRNFLQILSDEVVGVAGDSSENRRVSNRATISAAEGGDADEHIALTVLDDQRTTAVTLKI